MKTVQIYDPAMCCPTGVCGPEVDPALVTFAADLKWLEEQGIEVQRFGLTHNPAAFVENDRVRDALTNTGEAALPMVLAGDAVIASGHYPKRDALAAALGLAAGEAATLFSAAVAELVAIAAAIASNCEPCLRHHVHEAEKLGVTTADIQQAITLAAKVKEAPHQKIMRMAAQLTGEPDPAGSGCGCREAEAEGKGSCCS
jgi:AhpD family alkylhydroperoxidase